MMDDLPYDGWPECWEEHGTHPGSDEPVIIRVGTYWPNNDPDAGSIALCTSGGQPILINEDAARGLRELLDWSIESRRADVEQLKTWRQSAARDLVDGAVLSRDQWDQVIAAVHDGDNADTLTDILTASAPTSWLPDKPTHSPSKAEE